MPTIAELRQTLIEVSRQLEVKKHDASLSEHDRKNLAYAEDKVDGARSALFNCESQQ